MKILRNISPGSLVMRLVALATCSLLLLATAAPALAADVQQGDNVIIAPGEVINDDVYAFGSNIQILGTVNGDVFAVGNSVTVGGTVTGSVFATANTVAITGNVGHSIHAAGNTIAISGPVAQDATLASGSVNLSPGAQIGRDVLLATGTANLTAPIARNVKATAGDLTLTAPVGGDFQAQVTTLRLTDQARVDGSLIYTSSNDASIAPGASVGNGVQHLLPQASSQAPTPLASTILVVVDWLKGLVGFAAIGLLLTLLLPRFSANTLQTARTAFWSSLGVGFALFVGMPIAAAVVFILGIFVGGWMLGFALLAIYAMACAVGYTYAAILTGNVLVQTMKQRPQHLVWNMLEGLAILGLISLIPFVGGLVEFLACVLGLGAFTLTIVHSYRTSQTQPEVTPIAASVQPQLAAA
jgi:cytoskeletal protein CcmA (bactofilin family)